MGEPGAYMVTGSTHQKLPHFASPDRLTFLRDQLLRLATEYRWQMQAWAVFTNHYHFVALSPANSATLSAFIRHLHSITARWVHQADRVTGRQVWFQYWDTHLTFQRSYFARLNYVHNNPVKHGLVDEATAYRWCSAAWFAQKADTAFARTVQSFKTDRLSVRDDF